MSEEKKNFEINPLLCDNDVCILDISRIKSVETLTKDKQENSQKDKKNSKSLLKNKKK